MNVFFILAIVLASIGIAALLSMWIIDEYNLPEWLILVINISAIAGCILGVVLALVGLVVSQINYDEETVQICQNKGGVVTKDNHCFKDGHPIEFSKGVWMRL